MANQVYVKNEGPLPYKDTFRGKDINISSGGKIQMQRREAISFLGMMSPSGPDGKPIEKRLVLIPATKEEKKEVGYICNLDGKKFDTKKELEDHLKKVSSKTVTRDKIDAAKKEEVET